MADVKWIKIATNIFDNRKIKQIETLPDGDAIIVIWVKLLCLAGNINDNGMIYFTNEIPYTEQMLATQFNRPLTTVQLAMQTFKNFGMIDVIDDILHISSWEKYQNIDGLNKIREQTRVRVAKHREKQKLLQCNVTSNATVTEGNATEEDIEEDKNKNKKKNNKFTPPTVEEVKNYCLERGNNIDAEQFVDFYSSKGWKVGSNSMKDWKACVRTWERRTNKVGANGIKLTDEKDDILDGIL